MYLIFGGLTTLISWITYGIFILIFKNTNIINIFSLNFQINIIISNMLSWLIAFCFAFVTNKLFVFNSKKWDKKIVIHEFVTFLLARIFTGILEFILVPFLVAIGLNQTIFNIDGIISKILVTVIVIILNYIFSKYIVFKKKEK